MEMDGIVNHEPTPNHAYRYNGKELDEVSKTYEFKFRYYDPTIGKFTGVDPIADDFAHLSPFNYAGNSPIGNVDLWGLQPVSYEEGFSVGQPLAEGQTGPQLAPANDYWLNDAINWVNSKVSQISGGIQSGVNNTLSYFLPESTSSESYHTSGADLRYLNEGSLYQGFSAEAQDIYNASPEIIADATVNYMGPLLGVRGRGVNTRNLGKNMGSTVLGTDAATMANAGRMVPEKGIHQLLVHGHVDNFIIDGEMIAPKTVARTMLQNGFKQGTPVRCISCYTGIFGDGAAYQL
jgi:RHS repeat-associated protein